MLINRLQTIIKSSGGRLQRIVSCHGWELIQGRFFSSASNRNEKYTIAKATAGIASLAGMGYLIYNQYSEIIKMGGSIMENIVPSSVERKGDDTSEKDEILSEITQLQNNIMVTVSRYDGVRFDIGGLGETLGDKYNDNFFDNKPENVSMDETELSSYRNGLLEINKKKNTLMGEIESVSQTVEVLKKKIV